MVIENCYVSDGDSLAQGFSNFLFDAPLVIKLRFGLVWLYSISTIGGYLMPNPAYTYILDIYDL